MDCWRSETYSWRIVQSVQVKDNCWSTPVKKPGKPYLADATKETKRSFGN